MLKMTFYALIISIGYLIVLQVLGLDLNYFQTRSFQENRGAFHDQPAICIWLTKNSKRIYHRYQKIKPTEKWKRIGRAMRRDVLVDKFQT